MRCKVTYEDGEPTKVRFGSGYFGDPCSLASINGSEAIVLFDNAGSTDFERGLAELPFVDEVTADAE